LPRYFFNVHDGMCYPDEDGVELRDRAAAKSTALWHIGDLAKLYEDGIVRGQSLNIDVTDEEQTLLFTLRLELKLPNA
jgi:hypothetical protein